MVKGISKAVKPLDFFRQATVELKKCKWPTRTEAIRLTIVVILFSVIVGIFIGVLDYLFTKIVAILVSIVK